MNPREQMPSDRPPVVTFHAVEAAWLIREYGLEEAVVIVKRMIEESMRGIRVDKL